MQATLDAMMGAVSDAADIGRRALKLQARALGAENAFLEPCLHSKSDYFQDGLGTNA